MQKKLKEVYTYHNEITSKAKIWGKFWRKYMWNINERRKKVSSYMLINNGLAPDWNANFNGGELYCLHFSHCDQLNSLKCSSWGIGTFRDGMGGKLQFISRKGELAKITPPLLLLGNLVWNVGVYCIETCAMNRQLTRHPLLFYNCFKALLCHIFQITSLPVFFGKNL